MHQFRGTAGCAKAEILSFDVFVTSAVGEFREKAKGRKSPCPITA